MRALLLTAFQLCMVTWAMAQFNVTFRVDMDGVATAFGTPEVNGTFNNWCGNCIPMTDANNDGIWEVTVPLEAGTYEYKFSHDAWLGQEELAPGSSCTVTNNGFTNRSLNVSEDMILPIACWGTCAICGGAALEQMDLPVTFEASNIDYGLIGFGGADVSTIEEDPTDATNQVAKVIKSATAQSWAGTTITAPAQLGLATAIPFAPGQTQMTLRVWSPDAGIPVRLKVEDHTDATRSVETEALTTEANAWQTLTFDFANQANGTAAINYTYTYDKPTVFFNFGTTGAVAGEKTYYFDDLAMGEAQAVNYNVTFSVDMNQFAGSFTTMNLSGNFNNWCGDCAPMSDSNNDGVWELTVSLAAGSYEYKFSYDNWTGSEQLAEGLPCTVGGGVFVNRTLVVDGDETLPAVCYASCIACAAADTYDVTFRVDMNQVTDNFTTPEVNGNFNGWCGGCAPMSDANGDGIWELTIALAAGTYEYKFAYDSWAGQENLLPGGTCTITTGAFTNRALTVSADAVLDVVCWGSCASCDSQTGPFSITFRVDMSQVTDAYTTPEINGTFNGWCGGCAPMSDTNNDDIWEITIPLNTGTYEYKFAYDNWAGQENLTSGSSCTITTDGFTNRSLNVTENTTLDVVCWGSCAACIVGVEENESRGLVVFPNPANDQLNLRVNEQGNSIVRVVDARGALILTHNMTRSFATLDVSTLQSGLYYVQVWNGQAFQTSPVMIEK